MRFPCPVFLAALLLLAAGEVRGDDTEVSRSRKVKVALALAEAQPATVKRDTDEQTRAAKVAAVLNSIPSPPPFAPVPVIAPAPMPREVLVPTDAPPCDCLTTGECSCGSHCRCREDAAGILRIVKRPVWHTDYDKALKDAKPEQTVVVLFTDPVNCVPCKLLEAHALADAEVRDELARCVCVRVDVTTPAGKAVLARFNAHGDRVDRWPAIKAYRAGIRVADHTGNMSAETLLKLIR